jgi:serine/threonine protein kinase/tetratricopeptide (TPR) repeat protein
MTIECPWCNTQNASDSQFCKRCATPLPESEAAGPTRTLETPTPELTTGSTFAGRYQIIEELGKGGMGRVYKVLDKETNEKIALKLIKPDIASDKKTIDRFRNELTTARKISQKNVCRMYDLNSEKGNYFITMEYVSGGDLKKFIRRSKQLTAGTAISIAKQICDGLIEAHGLGIVHRDLKPGNIMLDDDGNVRIMDFGIARTMKEKGITGSGVMIGTPEYMSPEQVEAKDVDMRSDLYSLGVILYEMTTGRLPFEADSPFAVGIKHKNEQPKDPKELNPNISSELSRVILKCLEKDKEKRYQSAGELRSDLERTEQGLPTTQRAVPKRVPVTSREITVSFNVRKVFIPAILMIAAALAAVVIWHPWTKKLAPPSLSDKASLAVMYFKNNTGDKGLDNWRTALSDSIITDLSQSRYFEVLSSDRLFGILRKLNLLDAANYATEDLRKVAAEGGVNYVITGSLSRAGDKFRIDYVIQEIPSGKTRGSHRVEGRGETSIFSMVDEMTRQIKQNFDLSRAQIAGDVDREIETITTPSAEAFKYYSEGRQAHNAGEYQKSVALMERAVTADPEFAMAYRSLAMAYGNMNLQAKSEEYMNRAFELSDRLPDRERYLIEGDFYRRKQTTYAKAIEAYDKLLELYPDDPIGNNNLATIYADLEQWDKAIEKYNAALQHTEPGVQTITGLAGMYIYKGQIDKAIAVILDYIESHADSAVLRRRLAMTYVLERKFDLAEAEADKAFSLDPTSAANIYTRGSIFLFKGDVAAARLEYAKLVERDNPVEKVIGTVGFFVLDSLHGKFAEAIERSEQGIAICRSFNQKGWEFNFHLKLGEIYLGTERAKEALGEFDQAWQIAVDGGYLRGQWLVLVDRGACFLKTGSIPDALKTAEELKKLIETGLNQKAIREYHYLAGLVEYQKGNYRGAMEHLKTARSLLPAENDPWDGQARFSFALGQAYYKEGNLSAAQQAYEEILPMTYGRHFYPAIYALAFYELGKVFQDQGNTASGIENYQKFLELWKDADPGLPAVKDAKQRLARLKN